MLAIKLHFDFCRLSVRMELALEEAQKNSKSMGHNPIYVTSCKENSNSIIKKDGICVITDKTLDIFSETKAELKASLPWVLVSHFSIEKSNIKLKFAKKSITLTSDFEYNKIIGAICHVLQQVLPSYDARLLKLDSYNVPKIKYNGLGAYIRFQEICRLNGKYMPPQSLEKLRFALMSGQKDIKLDELGDPFSFLPPLLTTISLCPFVQSISIPPIPKQDVYQYIDSSAANISRLHFIEISGKATKLFDSFMSKLDSIRTSRLQGLSFTYSQFSENQLKILSDFVAKNKISSLGFSSAIPNASMPFFYKNFFKSSMENTLTVLNFDGTRNINIAKLFPLIKNVYFLSLENCHKQVDSIFSQIAQVGFKNLRGINVSKNQCEHFPLSAFSIPKTLISILANDIHWGEYCLHNILSVLFNRDVSKLKLSLGHVQCSNEEWNRVFKIFGNSQFNSISSFTWDANPLHPNILQFLLRNPQLEYLSVSECLSQFIPATINGFSNFLGNCNSLRFLIARGSDRKYIGKMVGAIIRAISNMNSLIHLDISNNKLGDQGLAQLKKLYQQQTSLQVIAFDGSMPQTFGSLLDVLDIAAQSLDKIRTSFPLNDMLEFRTSGKITPEQYEGILRKFQKAPSLSEKEGEYPIPPNSIFLEPFSIFMNVHSTSMPKYLSPSELKSLCASPEKPQLNTNSPVKSTSNTNTPIKAQQEPQKEVPKENEAVDIQPVKTEKAPEQEVVKTPVMGKARRRDLESMQKKRIPQTERPQRRPIVESSEYDYYGSSGTDSAPHNQPRAVFEVPKTAPRKPMQARTVARPRLRGQNDSMDDDLPMPMIGARSIQAMSFLSVASTRSALPKNRKFFIDPSDYSEDEMVQSPFKQKKPQVLEVANDVVDMNSVKLAMSVRSARSKKADVLRSSKNQSMSVTNSTPKKANVRNRKRRHSDYYSDYSDAIIPARSAKQRVQNRSPKVPRGDSIEQRSFISVSRYNQDASSRHLDKPSKNSHRSPKQNHINDAKPLPSKPRLEPSPKKPVQEESYTYYTYDTTPPTPPEEHHKNSRRDEIPQRRVAGRRRGNRDAYDSGRGHTPDFEAKSASKLQPKQSPPVMSPLQKARVSRLVDDILSIDTYTSELTDTMQTLKRGKKGTRDRSDSPISSTLHSMKRPHHNAKEKSSAAPGKVAPQRSGRLPMLQDPISTFAQYYDEEDYYDYD